MHFNPVTLVALSVSPLSVRTVDPFRIATGVVDTTRSILVEATLTRGKVRMVGLGEGACLPPVTAEDQPDALAAVERAIPMLKNIAFADDRTLLLALDRTLGTTPVARSAVEVAILAALAALDGLPLWRWLAEDPKADAPIIESDITIPILEPSRMAELAAQWWAMGFRKFKLKVGHDLAKDLASLDAIAAVAPKATFQPDANAGLRVDEALAYHAAAKQHGLRITCFEQPCATLVELRQVKDLLAIPVLADESVKTMADFDALVAADAASGINLKIGKTGSLLRCLALGRAAQQRGMPLMVGGMVETHLGMTTAAHLCAALGGVAFPDLDTAWLLADNPFSGGYIATRDGDGSKPGPFYSLPELPGLAITLA